MNLRASYLSLVGLVFLSAFLSYYDQFPGLLSSSGILPVNRVLPSLFPSIDASLSGWVDLDSFCDLLALIGVCLSSAVAGGFHHGAAFLSLTCLYYILVSLGQVFYSFQWDILLLECGFVTAICFAPWRRFTARSTKDTSHQQGTSYDAIGAWPVRFLIFKLMFMSGVVKIQANCPTWNNLTALEYHFATQCLPSPLSWYAHQLHPFLLRSGVAATYVIEISAAFLLIAPSGAARLLGAHLQIMLQVLIILTGNYNFFNVLTIILCLPCIEQDKWLNDQDESTWLAGQKMVFNRAQHFLCWLFLGWASCKMFDIYVIDKSQNVRQSLGISLKLTKTGCEDMINASVPIAVHAAMTFVAASTMIATMRHPSKWFSIVAKGVLCEVCTGIMAIPLLFLTPQLQQKGFFGVAQFSLLWQKVQPFHIANGYGLFRRMTGVGRSKGLGSMERWGWAGLPPSIVARPEIILEGILNTSDDSTEEWVELNFRWKPGNLTERPRQIAPHQPRLDWQLWFAALGKPEHSPWFIQLLDKILDGCSPVINLLNEPRLSRGSVKLRKIRARLWNYDFTRLDTDWSRRIPGVSVIANGTHHRKVIEPPAMNSTQSPSLWRGIPHWPHQFWTRDAEREYFPAVEPGNRNVGSFLSAHGYIKQNGGGRFEKVCMEGKDRCLQLPTASFARSCCLMCEGMRARNIIWAPPIFVFVLAAVLHLLPSVRSRDRNIPKVKRD